MTKKSGKRGFSLAELLVSLALFTTFFSAVVLLFTGAVRTVEQGQQMLEALETSRGALAIIERDLTTCFTSRDHGDYYTFYGTPIGMTFVGIVDKQDGVANYSNISRVTYVVHRSAGFRALQDTDGRQVNTFALLRYIEPGVDDLETFPVEWDALIHGETGSTLQVYIEDRFAGLFDFNPAGASSYSFALSGKVFLQEDANFKEEYIKAMKRQLWIEMLAGTNDKLPNIWTELGLDPMDYVVAENIVIEAKSVTNPDLGHSSVKKLGLEPSLPFFGFPFFQYTDPGSGIVNTNNQWQWSFLDYWLAEDNLVFHNADKNYQKETIPVVTNRVVNAHWGSPLIPRIPGVVKVHLRMFFESPYPGASDHDRTFEQIIDIPSAYARQKLRFQQDPG